jgi:hypothetical protein
MTEQEARQAIIQDPTLVTDDRKFREHVVVKLAVLESEARRDRDEVRGIEKTLYGDDGKGGLVADVAALKKDTSLWFRGTAILQGLVAIALAYLGIKN